MNSTAPLASIVVRTMGRPQLPRALASAAAQVHRPIEIVVVDAAGGEAAPALPPGIPARVVRGVPMDRPKAANAGLDAARGEWLLFLDEDDEIARDHVSTLMATAMVAGAPVAYSQTRLVAPGAPDRVFGGPFDRARLRQSNYISLHAALFHRSLLARGARFDESLPRFEDWDFWLQLAALADFAFVPRPGAIYHATEGASGAGAGSNLDREAALAARARIAAKWGAEP